MIHFPSHSALILPEISSGIHKRHTPESLKQARKIQSDFDISKFGNRRGVTGITIDSLTSPDLDDGVHIEELAEKKGWRLFISIASPTEIIDPNSAIDIEAIQRATSIYFGESHMYHMLPNLISTNIASLNHQQHRLTLTLELEINRNFEVIQKDIYPSIFYNRQRHDPQSFTRGINNTSEVEYEYFSLMHELARGLRKVRDTSLRVDTFDDDDRRITFGEKIPGHNNSHISSFVIQEFMLLANREVAKYMIDEDISGIYRSHMPEYADIQDLPKVLDRAEYTPYAQFHRGLGVPEYMHFTSPIRRLADYISQRQILCLLHGKDAFYTHQEIQDLCRYINLQITSTIGHQKEESLDMHGKRVIRKGKKDGGNMQRLLHHIKHRTKNGLRTPKSVREEVIHTIREKEEVDDWIIKTFLTGTEKEIIEEIRDKILSGEKTKRYLGILGNMESLGFSEGIREDAGSFYYQIRCSIFGEIYRVASKIQEVEEITSTIIDGNSLKHTQVFLHKNMWYKSPTRSFGDAKNLARKKALKKVFEQILSS